MSMDFYPAKMIDGQLAQALPMRSFSDRIFSGHDDDVGVPNPAYVPGSSVNMGNVTVSHILRVMQMRRDDPHYFEAPVADFITAFRAAVRHADTVAHYEARFEALFKVCADTEATHIICV